MAKIKLIPSPNIQVEVDGIPIRGDFRIDSEWCGLIKLVCTAPVASIIIRKPAMGVNPYDYVPAIFGGGQSPEKLTCVEADILITDITLPKPR